MNKWSEELSFISATVIKYSSKKPWNQIDVSSKLLHFDLKTKKSPVILFALTCTNELFTIRTELRNYIGLNLI